MVFESSIGDIYYSKVGRGPHLTFLHGFCESGKMWSNLVPALEDHYTCIFIDLPGFGESPLLRETDLTQMAQMVNDVHSELGIEDSVLLGHSMGGYVALEAVSQNENLYGGLGLIHSTSYADNAEKKEARSKVIKFLEEYEAPYFLQQFYPQLVHPKHLSRLEEDLWNLVKDSSKQGIINATKAMMTRKDHRETLANLQIPVLFLTGDSDVHFPMSDIYKQAALCGMAQINVLTEVGHLSVYEDLDNCLAAILEFCSFRDTLS